MVVKLFGEVENKNVPIPEFPEHPFQEEHLRVSSLVCAHTPQFPLADFWPKNTSNVKPIKTVAVQNDLDSNISITECF